MAIIIQDTDYWSVENECCDVRSRIFVFIKIIIKVDGGFIFITLMVNEIYVLTY